jgi:hypothetical protein
MLITTSKDLLFVVLAFCALWLTVFLSWMLYYVIAILRDAESLVHTVRHATEKIDRIAQAVHEKFDRSATSLSLLAQAVKEIVVWGIRERANIMKEPAARGGKKKK